MITWAIWNAQNKFIFVATQEHPSSIQQATMFLLQE